MRTTRLHRQLAGRAHGREQTRAIFAAASHVQRAADFINGLQALYVRVLKRRALKDDLPTPR